jgi:hypothetical protein
MDFRKRKVTALLALLLVAPGCAYLHPDPVHAPTSQGTRNGDELSKQDEGNAPDDGFLRFLARTFHS